MTNGTRLASGHLVLSRVQHDAASLLVQDRICERAWDTCPIFSRLQNFNCTDCLEHVPICMSSGFLGAFLLIVDEGRSSMPGAQLMTCLAVRPLIKTDSRSVVSQSVSQYVRFDTERWKPASHACANDIRAACGGGGCRASACLSGDSPSCCHMNRCCSWQLEALITVRVRLEWSLAAIQGRHT
jgi:hypothetical protein